MERERTETERSKGYEWEEEEEEEEEEQAGSQGFAVALVFGHFSGQVAFVYTLFF